MLMTGEPLPIYGERSQRVGMLTLALSERGHDVTWWSTTFDHQSKSYLFNSDTEIVMGRNLRVQLLHTRIRYTRNISLARMANHYLIGRSFLRAAERCEAPDVIISSFPTIDLSYCAVEFAKRRGIPVVIDIRDMWPDIFLRVCGSFTRPVVKKLIRPLEKKTGYTFESATSLVAVSRQYLNWAVGYASRNVTSQDRVIPLGYESLTSSAIDEKKKSRYLSSTGISNCKIRIWFAGTFGRTYDLQTVIEGARILDRQRNDVQIVLSGDGENRKHLEQLAAGISNVIFTGWVDAERLRYLRDGADVGLMAYAAGAPQGMPNKVYEYLSCGIPMLSCLKGESEDFIRRHRVGLMYQAGSPTGFAQMLSQLVDDRESRDEMGLRARRLFEAEYSSEIVYGRYADYIEGFERWKFHAR